MEHNIWSMQAFGQELNMGTLVMVWISMAVVLLFAFLATRNLQIVPSRMQVVGEGFFDLCRSITYGNEGKKGDQYLFFIGSVFLFVLFANLLGQVPWRLINAPNGTELKAATADFAVTTGLAIMAVVAYFTVGIKRKGFKYFKHYVQPFWWMLPLNMMEDVTRPMSLSMRLYFNILVGEVLAGITLSVLPLGLPLAVIFFEILVALIQAYVFALLSAVYISLVADEHH